MSQKSSTPPKLEKKKLQILLWFRFLQICIKDRKYKINKDFYKTWGTVTPTMKFDPWWNKNKFLFDDVRVVNEIVKKPSLLHISIPLDQDITKTLKDVKYVVESEQIKRLKKKGLDPTKLKSKVVRGLNDYNISGVKEFKGDTYYVVLLMLEFYIKHKKPPINPKFLDKLYNWFDKERPRVNWKPHIIGFKSKDLDWDESNVRQVRRYINTGQKICENVSKGKFPGPVRLG